MGKSYRPYLPDQDFLLPPSLREWLPENHLIYFVSDVIDTVDLSAMDAVYGEEQRGQPPYDPRMMTKLLVYGYCVGVFSSRRIELRVSEDIASGNGEGCSHTWQTDTLGSRPQEDRRCAKGAMGKGEGREENGLL
jgi:hypothetical protein